MLTKQLGDSVSLAYKFGDAKVLDLSPQAYIYLMCEPISMWRPDVSNGHSE